MQQIFAQILVEHCEDDKLNCSEISTLQNHNNKIQRKRYVLQYNRIHNKCQ